MKIEAKFERVTPHGVVYSWYRGGRKFSMWLPNAIAGNSSYAPDFTFYVNSTKAPDETEELHKRIAALQNENLSLVRRLNENRVAVEQALNAIARIR